MEEVSLLKLIIVGLPETVLNLLIGLVLCRDNVKKNWKSFILKMCISVITILITIFFVRSNINSLLWVTVYMVFVYTSVFKYVWEMNYRQSILSACSTIFLLTFLETITLPLYTMLVKGLNFTNIFDGGMLFSPLMRTLHIIVFLILTRWNLRNNEVISGEWSRQNQHSKIAIIIIIISMFWCMASMLNYVDFTYKISVFETEASFLVGNIRLVFWMTIWFFIFLLVLAYYIFSFLDTQKMFDISLEEILSTVGDELSKEEIKGYIDILQQKYNEKRGE
ncbi:hypothetical protein [Defluviitalea saccharophila]|uniref:Uncharacterized protein n=1 Tax=Defluviitalea saccharophila TaxID=879970 RepID=A0ABZ2Y296_9FIRM